MIELTGDPQRDKEIIGFANRRNYWWEANDGLKDLIAKLGTNTAMGPEELREFEQLKKHVAALEALMQKK